MAAYAALVSLMNTTEQILNHPRLSTSLDKEQTESLGETIKFLLDFIEKYSSESSKLAEDLEIQVASAAHAAEDVIEAHLVDRILAGSTAGSCSFLLDLQEVIKGMDSIKEKVIKVKEERLFKDLQSTYSMPVMPSASSLTTGNSTMVGFEDELIQLLDGLSGGQSNRQVISIVGMGGIGKTILARNAFENLLIVKHFDIRAWATVSQDSSANKILLQLPSSPENIARYEEMSEDELGEKLGENLYKTLSGRRYLIILDDIWSIEIWDKIKFFFPDNNNRSRIVVTTRLTNMAIHVGSSHLKIKFLDEEKSWSLLRNKYLDKKVALENWR